MVQVSGTTYRIVEKRSVHEIVRVMDDRIVGAFRHGPTLELTWGELPEAQLLAIARHAHRSARLSWQPLRSTTSSWIVRFFQRSLADWQQALATLAYALHRPQLQPVPVLARRIQPGSRPLDLRARAR